MHPCLPHLSGGDWCGKHSEIRQTTLKDRLPSVFRPDQQWRLDLQRGLGISLRQQHSVTVQSLVVVVGWVVGCGVEMPRLDVVGKCLDAK
jgi:hypothetical protein